MLLDEEETLMLLDQPVRQIAYAVADVREFATKHSRSYGSGPYLMVEDAEISGTIRGRDVTFKVDVAFGQWGEMQVEVLHQTTPGPGLIHELYPEGSGRFGVHHFCSIVDNLDAAIAEFEADGCETVFRGTMPLGTNAVMMDTEATLGHFTELYMYTDEIRWLYEGVKAASIGFDGSNPMRSFVDYMPSALKIQS